MLSFPLSCSSDGEMLEASISRAAARLAGVHGGEPAAVAR